MTDFGKKKIMVINIISFLKRYLRFVLKNVIEKLVKVSIKLWTCSSFQYNFKCPKLREIKSKLKPIRILIGFNQNIALIGVEFEK